RRLRASPGGDAAVLWRNAVPGTALEHCLRVGEDATETGAIGLDHALGIVSRLDCSPADDVPVTAEYVHVPPVPAAAAEEIELLGQRPSQHHQVAALGDDVVVVHQRFGAIAGAIDDDVFS